MPRIVNYEKDTTINDEDKVIGSDQNGATKNFTLADIKTYVNTGASESGAYKHTQTSASATWTVNHNLDLENFLPSVTLKLDTGTYANVQAYGMVTYVNENQLTIGFGSARSGLAYIKK